jgi:hypothetical protein
MSYNHRRAGRSGDAAERQRRSIQDRPGVNHLLRLSFERPPPTFPMASARRDGHNPAHQRAQAPLGVTLGVRGRPLLQVAGDVHPLDPAPDADPEAGLRCIDAAALRAPPHRRTLERLVPIKVLGFDLRIAT